MVKRIAVDHRLLADSLPPMIKLTSSPRIVPSPEMEVSSVEREWSEQEHEPRMFGISGGLTASGGDFGFEVPAATSDETDGK